MRRKMLFAGLGVLALTLILVSCPGEPPGEDETVTEITITGIPNDDENPDANYKIYVRISNKMNPDPEPGNPEKDRALVAEANAIIGGETSLTLPLYKPYPADSENPESWSGKGTLYIAIVISPKEVSGIEDIFMHADMPPLKSSYNWNGMMKLEDMITNDLMRERIQAFYNGVIVPDTDITKN
ncbi:MAG TPA: hypothetical protein DEQ14_00795 [Treponema sp.]|nr:hypothetical protein [Treponema sp.]